MEAYNRRRFYFAGLQLPEQFITRFSQNRTQYEHGGKYYGSKSQEKILRSPVY